MGAKQKIPLAGPADGKRVVTVEAGATEGATVGENLRLPDGTIVTAAMIINPATPAGSSDPDFTYWRLIQEIPPNVTALEETTTTGLYVVTGDGTSATREIEVEAGELVVFDGDGVAGNPVLGLADVSDDGITEPNVQLFKRDGKGRTTGTADATTDELTEGSANLYFTDERAQDAVGAILTDTADIELVYSDGTPSISANLSAAIHDILDDAISVTNTPTDGDIPEFDGSSSTWLATKSPRELYLDGGNF